MFGILSALLASALAFSCAAGTVSDSLTETGGRLWFFSDGGEGGLKVSLLSDRSRSWGFLEWPDRGWYGFFQTEEEEKPDSGWMAVFPRDLEVLSGAGNLSGKSISIKRGIMGRTLLVSIGTSPIDRLKLIRRPSANKLRLRMFSAGQSDEFALAMLAAGPAVNQQLDEQLRRGGSLESYARSYWAERQSRRLDIPPGASYSLSWMERQIPLFDAPGLLCIQTERYRFDGGAHGDTVALAAILDLSERRSLTPDDIFVPGWEDKLAPLLHTEALKTMTERGMDLMPGGKAGTLRGYGFFEESIRPSSDMVLCDSGVGFHYDRYELAPYAWGDFLFVIPWPSLMPGKKGEILKEDLPASIHAVIRR